MGSEVGWHYSGQWWIWAALMTVIVFLLTYRDIRLSTTAGVILGAFEIAGVRGARPLDAVLQHEQAEHPAVRAAQRARRVERRLPRHGVRDPRFIGFEAAAPLGEEAKHPRRTVPFAVVGSALAIGVFYILCAYAWVFGAGFNNFVAQATGADPWRNLGKVFWSTGWIVVFLAICNSIAANSNAAVNAATRVFYALARNGLAPRPLGHVHPKFKTPSTAIIWMSAIRVHPLAAARLEVGPADRLLVDRHPGRDRRRGRVHADLRGRDLGVLGEAARGVQSAAAPRAADRRDRALLLPALLPVLQVRAHLPDQVRELDRDRLDRRGHRADGLPVAHAARAAA